MFPLLNSLWSSLIYDAVKLWDMGLGVIIFQWLALALVVGGNLYLGGIFQGTYQDSSAFGFWNICIFSIPLFCHLLVFFDADSSMGSLTSFCLVNVYV